MQDKHGGRIAAYWDSNFAQGWADEAVAIEMRDYFAAAGYEILDADQLKVWMDAHRRRQDQRGRVL